MIIPWVFCGFYGLMRILTFKPEKEMKDFSRMVAGAQLDTSGARFGEPQPLAQFHRWHWINPCCDRPSDCGSQISAPLAWRIAPPFFGPCQDTPAVIPLPEMMLTPSRRH